MRELIAWTVSGIFLALSLLHLYWAAGGRAGWSAAIPEVNGRPAFTPSAGATLVVAGALAICALLAAALSGLVSVPVSADVLRWLGRVLAIVLVFRALGDFRLVGFFKRVRGSRFARMDTLFYSPLVLLLGIGMWALVQGQ